MYSNPVISLPHSTGKPTPDIIVKDNRLVPVARGRLSKAFRDVLARQRSVLSGDQLIEAPPSHSGHPNLRFSADILICEVWERVLASTHETMIDLGSKYYKMAKLLLERTGVNFEIPFTVRGDLDDQQRQHIKICHSLLVPIMRNHARAYAGNVGALQQDLVAEVERYFGAARADIAVILPSYRTDIHEFVTKVAGLRRRRFIPIRPDISTYDRAYHAANLDRYNALRAQVGTRQFSLLTLEQVVIGTYQEFARASLIEGAIVATDVAYYLGDVRFERPRSTLYACHAEFPAIFGRYYLPYMEGEYTIRGEDGLLRVAMKTQGAGNVYTHPAVTTSRPEVVIRHGWYTQVLVEVPALGIVFHNIPCPEALSSSRPQHNVLHAHLSRYSLVKTVDVLVRRFAVDQLLEEEVSSWTTGSFGYLANDFQDWLTQIRKGQVVYEYQRGFRWASNKPLYTISDYVSRALGMYTRIELHERAQDSLFVGGPRAASEDAAAAWGLNRACSYVFAKMMFVKNICTKAATSMKSVGKLNFRYYLNQKLTGFSKLNPIISTRVDEEEHTRARVAAWLKKGTAPMMLKGSKVVPAKTMVRAVKTGYDVVVNELKGAEKLSAYEWTTSDHNNLYGMYGRFLSNTVQPDPKVVARFRRFMRRWLGSMQNEMNAQPLPEIESPYDYYAARDWPADKKARYRAVAYEYLNSPTAKPLVGTYFSMVKTGEVYYHQGDLSERIDEHGFSDIKDSRTRCVFNPSNVGCSILVHLHSYMIKRLTAVLPMIAYGYDGDRYRESFQSPEGWTNLYLDGSKFETTQYKELKEIIVDGFIRLLEPLIEHYSNELAKYSVRTGSELKAEILRALRNHDGVIFAWLPGVESGPWPHDVRKLWKRDWAENSNAEPSADHFYIKVSGCTWSGHPFTYFNNSVASLSYFSFYLFESGLQLRELSPDTFRTSKHVNVCISGDDLRSRGSLALMTKVMLVIKGLSASDVQPNVLTVIGLGQIMKRVDISETAGVEFCSKWFFETERGVVVTRDMSKVLKGKQFYKKNEAVIIDNPSLHAKALLTCLQSERVSMLLESIVEYRLKLYGDSTLPAPKGVCNWTDHPWSDLSYAAEAQVNDRLGVGLSDLLGLMATGTLQWKQPS